jgi:hypothetical protein
MSRSMTVTGEKLCRSALSKPRISNIDQWRTSAGKGIHVCSVDVDFLKQRDVRRMQTG